MQRDLRSFLWDVQGAIADVFEFLGGKNFEEYAEDNILRAAVERKLMVVGEALRQASHRFPEETLRLGTHTGFVGFQAFLNHEYADIKPKYVWNAVLLLPELRTRVAERLDELDSGGNNQQ